MGFAVIRFTCSLLCVIQSFIAGKDYSDALSILTTVDFVFAKKRSVSPGSQQQCINISIISDNIVEDTEIFTVLLTTNDNAVMLSPDEAEVAIIDNDRT